MNMKLIGKMMTSFGNGFIKMTQHRHYFLGWSIVMSLMLGFWMYMGTASNLLISLMVLTIIMDLLCWLIDAGNRGNKRFITFTLSTKKGDKNV